MNKWIIAIGILILVALGFLFIFNMTGNVITGAITGKPTMVVQNEVFRISEFGNKELNNEVKNGEDNSGSE
ncbi:hypothetical protein J4226_01285 [Candidatus Pacearchaeota archaeon]|nr:hypothetical protein [Candidatus Pacearchaeota archaeon]